MLALAEVNKNELVWNVGMFGYQRDAPGARRLRIAVELKDHVKRVGEIEELLMV